MLILMAELCVEYSSYSVGLVLEAVHAEGALPLQALPPVPTGRDRRPSGPIRRVSSAPVWPGNRPRAGGY